MKKEIYLIYTDGACHPNPGTGGWGAFIRFGHKTHKIYGGQSSTTNQRMELMAAIKGLEKIPENSKAILFTDSQYLVNGITKWIYAWKKNGWKNRAGNKTKNREYWEKLDELSRDREVTFKWVKAHNGNKGNEIADSLAVMGRKEHARNTV